MCKCICKIFQSTVPQGKVLELLHGHCGLVPSRMMKRMPLSTRISQSTGEVLKDTMIRFNMYRGVAGLLVNPNPELSAVLSSQISHVDFHGICKALTKT